MSAAAERAALENEALLDATVDAVVIINHRGHIETFNRSAERLFGYRAEEVLGRNVNILMTPRDQANHDAYIARYLATGIPHIVGIGREVEARRKDGSVFPVELAVGRIRNTEPPRFVGYMHDITLRRTSVAALQRERDRAQQYLDVAGVMLLALDVQGRVSLLNPRGCTVLGRMEAELLGRDWCEAVVPEDDREIARKILTHLAELPPGASYTCEYRIRSAQGEPRLIAWNCIALRDPENLITGLLCSGEDVTERRRVELEAQRSQQRAMHVSRLATMGEMAAGIAHELNQPLAAITNFAQASHRLLGVALPDIEEVREALRQIAAQAIRAGEIIRRLRNLVRDRATERELTDVNELIQEMLTLTQADARLHGVRLSLDLPSGLPRLELDRIQIQQVLLNLVRNAIEAMEGTAGVRPEIVIRTTLPADGGLEISVSDNGPGVNPEIGERMFEPFCTTKESGTGLGLAISRTIVQAHRGRLGYRAVHPHGACFYVRLPFGSEDSNR